MSKLAIATTLVKANQVLDSFIRYHQHIGFDYIFLFFDCATEAPAFDVARYRNVFVIPNDDELKKRWQSTKLFNRRIELSSYLSTEVMARQTLNVEVARQMCNDSGIDWLLHIDIDELFYSPVVNVRQHFSELTAKGITTVSYYNYEAAPTKLHVTDYFKEVTFFKKNPALLSRFQLNYLKQSSKNQFFLYYQNGKSAAHVGSDVEPKDVHSFYSANSTLASRACFILHYPVCGLDHFVEKYRQLGAFDDTWFGSFPVNIPFHLLARDVNKLTEFDKVKAFYESYVLYRNEELQKLLELGIVEEVKEPLSILHAEQTHSSNTLKL